MAQKAILNLSLAQVILIVLVSTLVTAGGGWAGDLVEPGKSTAPTEITFVLSDEPLYSIIIDDSILNQGLSPYMEWFADHIWTGIDDLKIGDSRNIMIGNHCIARITRNSKEEATMSKCGDAS